MKIGDWVMLHDIPYRITDVIYDGERLVLRSLEKIDRKGQPLVTIATPELCQPIPKEVVDIMRIS